MRLLGVFDWLARMKCRYLGLGHLWRVTRLEDYGEQFRFIVRCHCRRCGAKRSFTVQ